MGRKKHFLHGFWRYSRIAVIMDMKIVTIMSTGGWEPFYQATTALSTANAVVIQICTPAWSCLILSYLEMGIKDDKETWRLQAILQLSKLQNFPAPHVPRRAPTGTPPFPSLLAASGGTSKGLTGFLAELRKSSSM